MKITPRSVATIAVIFSLCAMGILEQLGYATAPQWFVVIGTAVVTEYIVEYWQDKNDVVPPTP